MELRQPTTNGHAHAKRGVLYVAFGLEYLVMAAHSALTVKRHSPDLGTQLVTNLPVTGLRCGTAALLIT